MRQKESRANVPWPVAPIPAIPSSASTASAPESRFDDWFFALDHWLHIWRRRNATFYRRLPQIERQIRLMLQRMKDELPEDMHKRCGVEKRSMLASSHALLARCLSQYRYDYVKSEDAVREFKTAMALAPEISSVWCGYVRHLVVHGRVFQALDAINSVDMHLIEMEHDSIAQQIINWALAYPEIAYGVRPEIIKHCIALVSRRRSGLLATGVPLPRAGDEKWQRSEILRVLWAGMQCSVPLDELCLREGIDEATYWRWRKKYLPKEWGTSPALV